MDQAFIQTRSGLALWPMSPNIEGICIEDIAFGLSREHRFGSQSDITVAQHSVIVSKYCSDVNKLWGELHDAPEGLGLRDIPKPLKYLPEFAAYRAAEKRLMNAVCLKFDLPLEEPAEVKKFDTMVLAAEIRDHMRPNSQFDYCREYGDPIPEKIPLWTKRRAYKEFLTLFHKLTKTRVTVLV